MGFRVARQVPTRHCACAVPPVEAAVEQAHGAQIPVRRQAVAAGAIRASESAHSPGLHHASHCGAVVERVSGQGLRGAEPQAPGQRRGGAVRTAFRVGQRSCARGHVLGRVRHAGGHFLGDDRLQQSAVQLAGGRPAGSVRGWSAWLCGLPEQVGGKPYESAILRDALHLHAE